MEFLLALLSLLTAATGVTVGAHAPETGVQQVAGVVAVAPSRQAAHRPLAAEAAHVQRPGDEPSPRVASAPAATAPRYADRRRE